MRLRYGGQWPSVYVREGGMVPHLRTCLQPVKRDPWRPLLGLEHVPPELNLGRIPRAFWMADSDRH